jgi:NAD(P)-dependent dehydrogenase (short-subunit alcohol dehydrogenase family)
MGPIQHSLQFHCTFFGCDRIVLFLHSSRLIDLRLPTIMARAGMQDNEDSRKKLLAPIPLGRMCETSDVGNAVAWLASDEASYITGAELAVDGGRAI